MDKQFKHLLYQTAKGNTVILFGMEQRGQFWYAWIKNIETNAVAMVPYRTFINTSTQLHPNESRN